jgi:DNA invertase Pin-like site-specific DNA recombinase
MRVHIESTRDDQPETNREVIMSNIAYIRVSSTDQNTGRQLADTGISFDRTFEDKTSGKDTNRPALTECLAYLRDGDELHVHSIDRLARSLQDLQKLVDDLVGKGVTVTFHKENLIFQNHGTQDPFAKLLFQVLGSFAEFERNIIRERQREGIERAKAKGKYSHGKGGRKQTIDRNKVKELRDQGVPFRKIAEEMGCSLSSVQRCLSEKP